MPECNCGHKTSGLLPHADSCPRGCKEITICGEHHDLYGSRQLIGLCGRSMPCDRHVQVKTTVPYSLRDLQRMVGEWGDQVFPKRTVHTTLSKLVLEEIPEFLLAKADDADEYADLLILVLDVAHQKGIDCEAALLAKHKKNTERAWAMTENGVYHHTPSQDDKKEESQNAAEQLLARAIQAYGGGEPHMLMCAANAGKPCNCWFGEARALLNKE